jgi:Putative Actinobacterial Holin-X, holin superfamily III
MADQATMRTMNGPGSNRSSAGGSVSVGGRMSDASAGEPSANTMVSNVAGFGENLLTLAELQARLSAMELRKNLDAATAGGAVILAGSVLAVASLPVALAGLAELLVSELALKRGYALLIVAAAAILIAGISVASAGFWLRRKRLGFPLSAEELTRNLNWLRTVLHFSGRPALRR